MFPVRMKFVGAGIGLFSLLYICIMMLQGHMGWQFDRHSREEMFFKQKNWNGIPISSNNFLYIKITNETFQQSIELEDRLLEINITTTDLTPLYDEYLPRIGINGIMNALEVVFKMQGQEDSHTLHQLGEYIAQKSKGHPSFAVEVSARDIFHKAPLHGVVWTYVSQFSKPQKLKKLFKFIDRDLCYFDSTEDFYSVWISCAHGVGHGLANLYSLEGVDKGLQVCGYHPNHDFVYACATGVIMSLADDTKFTTSSHIPCDTVNYPAACYKFKHTYFNQYAGEFPCEKLQDEYHMKGCLFGEGYTSKQQNVCWKYNPLHNPRLLQDEKIAWTRFTSCMDGVWQNAHQVTEETCSMFKDTPAYDACSLRILEKTKWNWDLLEG